MITDHHCHLQDNKIYPHIEDVLDRAKKNNINQFVVLGTSESDWDDVLELNHKYDSIIPAVGIHPWFIDKISRNWRASITRNLENHTNCLVGEIGLDMHFCADTIDAQIKIFTQQLEVAKDYHRAVSIHNLKSWHLMLPIIKKFPTVKMMLHSFSASSEIADQLSQFQHIYFSLSGNILNCSKKMKKVLTSLPLDKILLESDAPFLLPKYEKITNQEFNEPANIIYVLEKLSKIMNIDIEILEQQIAENSQRILNEY